MSTAQTVQDQLGSILAAFQRTPYENVGTALEAQLKAVDEWTARVSDQPMLVAMGGVLRAQIEAAQRLSAMQRQETENVISAMREAAKTIGVPAA